ncbi:MAG: hypothetical protein GF349_00800 [Candidatus Magasanikbacteria bacterium]|nr:hypothetical protein [Candidatus Magasanikbacteria bacterium]
MSTFKKKKLIRSKRICLRLKNLRQTKRVSLEELVQKTKLDKKYLKAIEDCRFEALPDAHVYQKNFIKCYLKALGVKPEPFLKQFSEEETTDKKIEHPKKILKQNPLSNLPNILKYIGFASVVVILVVYLGAQVKNIVQPPQIQIFSPEEGYITEGNSILIHGKTESEVSVSVNGQEISMSDNGEFKEFVDLTPGVNTLTIKAQKKHGKTTNITRHIILKDNVEFGLLK